MAKPSAGSSLLFGSLADSGQIKQRKNGSYRTVLKGVDEIDWFTDRPDRVEGTWKPQKLLREWDKYFARTEPNAQLTVEVGEQRELFTFEMFKPKMKAGKMIFDIKPLSDSSEDKIIDLAEKEMKDISLFIDNATLDLPNCFPDCEKADLEGLDMSGQNLYVNFAEANLKNANLRDVDLQGTTMTEVDLQSANLQDANINQAVLNFANLQNANLAKSNLDDANLYGANLNNANLQGANLTDADMTATNLANANLDGAIWLRTTCPDGTLNSGPPYLSGTQYSIAPCTAAQLNL